MKKQLLLAALCSIIPFSTYSEFNTKEYIALVTGAAIGTAAGTVTFKMIEQHGYKYNPFKKTTKPIEQDEKDPFKKLETAIKDLYLTTVYKPGTITTKLNQVAGCADAKKIFNRIIKQLRATSSSLKTQLPSSILLTGPSGVGKTLLAQAFAGETGYLCIKTNIQNLTEALSKDKISNIVKSIKECGPCILFIDDIENIGSPASNLLYEFIAEANSTQTIENPLFIIGTSNNPHLCCSNAINTDKFDYFIQLLNPHIEDRITLLDMYLHDTKHDPTIDIRKVAQKAYGFTGYDIKQLVNQATIIALENNAAYITQHDLYQAIDIMTLGDETKAYLCSDQEKLETAYHEAGHALAAILLPSKWLSFNSISILSREHCLGIVTKLVIGKHFTKEDALQRIAVALGGRAAEELIFNMVATSPWSDFQHATQMAQTMICKVGMTDILGKQVLIKPYELYAETTKTKIDNAITQILDEQYELVMNLLQENKDKLDTLAHAVLEKETMHAEEVYELLGIDPPKITMLN